MKIWYDMLWWCCLSFTLTYATQNITTHVLQLHWLEMCPDVMLKLALLCHHWGDSSATAGGGELTMRYGVVSMKSCTTCATPSNNSSCSSHGVWSLEFSSLSTTAAGGDLMTRYAVLSIKSCTSSVTPATKSSWLSVATSTYKDETFTYFTSV